MAHRRCRRVDMLEALQSCTDSCRSWPVAVASAAFAAAGEACRDQRFTVASHVGDVWQWPIVQPGVGQLRQRFAQALRRRLGIAQGDFRRRAESAQGIDARRQTRRPIATVLLAGKRALADERVRKFLLPRPSEDSCSLA